GGTLCRATCSGRLGCPSVTIDSPDVTLTIVSYNTADLLRRCLQSIRAIDPGPPVQTIVIDNAARDDRDDMVEREFPWVELIRNPSNRYFAPAHNQAFPLAR